MTLFGWNYNKKIVLKNTGSALSNYQIKFVIRRSSGTDSGYTCYVGENCEQDFDDIRFTAADGETLLSYWIEESDSSEAKIWVKVPSIVGDGYTEIYLYYGNAEAPAVSNGDDTFIFFDDFPGSSLNSSKWDTMAGGSGSVSVSNSVLIVTSSGGGYRIVLSDNEYGPANIAVRFYAQGTSVVSTNYWGFYHDSVTDNALFVPDEGRTRTRNNGVNEYKTISGITYTDWNIYEILWESTSVKFLVNDVEKSSHTTRIPDQVLKVYVQEYGEAGAKFDWFFVRQYTATEPTVDTWGGEKEVWDSRKKITINNTGSELTNYPLKFTINRFWGTDSGFTLHIGNLCEPDFRDIRFVKSDGVTPLDYWIEEKSPTTATVWVEVDVIAGSGTTDIYLIAGNPEVEDASDGPATFPFFDDFSGTLDTTTRWTVEGGSVATSNGTLILSGSSVIHSKSAVFGLGYACRAKTKYSESRGSSYAGFATKGSGTWTEPYDKAMLSNHYGYNCVCRKNGGSYYVTYPSWDPTPGQYYLFEVQRISDSSCKFFKDGSLSYEITSTAGIPTIDLNVTAYIEYGSSIFTHEFILVRPVVATEPTISSTTDEFSSDARVRGYYSVTHTILEKALIGLYTVIYSPPVLKSIKGKYSMEGPSPPAPEGEIYPTDTILNPDFETGTIGGNGVDWLNLMSGFPQEYELPLPVVTETAKCTGTYGMALVPDLGAGPPVCIARIPFKMSPNFLSLSFKAFPHRGDPGDADYIFIVNFCIGEDSWFFLQFYYHPGNITMDAWNTLTITRAELESQLADLIEWEELSELYTLGHFCILEIRVVCGPYPGAYLYLDDFIVTTSGPYGSENSDFSDGLCGWNLYDAVFNMGEPPWLDYYYHRVCTPTVIGDKSCVRLYTGGGGGGGGGDS